MAWLEKDRSDFFHIGFRWGNQRIKRSLRTKNRRKAEATRVRLEETLHLVKSGRLPVPDDVDPVVFLFSDGKLASPFVHRPNLNIGSLMNRFRDALPPNSMEANSVATLEVHLRHIRRLIGNKVSLSSIDLACLQRYVNQRAREDGRRGRPIAASTIKKELASFRSIWNWARSQKQLDAVFPNRGLRFPKMDDKPPFRTREQIEHQIERFQFDEDSAVELWECLFLSPSDIAEILGLASNHARHPVVLLWSKN